MRPERGEPAPCRWLARQSPAQPIERRRARPPPDGRGRRRRHSRHPLHARRPFSSEPRSCTTVELGVVVDRRDRRVGRLRRRRGTIRPAASSEPRWPARRTDVRTPGARVVVAPRPGDGRFGRAARATRAAMHCEVRRIADVPAPWLSSLALDARASTLSANSSRLAQPSSAGVPPHRGWWVSAPNGPELAGQRDALVRREDLVHALGPQLVDRGRARAHVRADVAGLPRRCTSWRRAAGRRRSRPTPGRDPRPRTPCPGRSRAGAAPCRARLPSRSHSCLVDARRGARRRAAGRSPRPKRAARLAAGSPDPPTMIIGWGCWTGSGVHLHRLALVLEGLAGPRLDHHLEALVHALAPALPLACRTSSYSTGR